MKTEGTNLHLLTISAFWSSSGWPLATEMSSRRLRSIPLGGRYRQVSLYLEVYSSYCNGPQLYTVFDDTCIGLKLFTYDCIFSFFRLRWRFPRDQQQLQLAWIGWLYFELQQWLQWLRCVDCWLWASCCLNLSIVIHESSPKNIKSIPALNSAFVMSLTLRLFVKT